MNEDRRVEESRRAIAEAAVIASLAFELVGTCDPRRAKGVVEEAERAIRARSRS